MTLEQIIDSVINSDSYIQLFPNESNRLSDIKEYIKEIHPDVCSISGATEATAKLIEYKNQLEKGTVITDDAGKITYFDKYFIVEGDEFLLSLSKSNFDSLKCQHNKHFNRYIPDSIEKLDNGKYKVSYPDRAVPLISVGKLPQEHLNWIESRLLEFCVWMENIGLCHSGINPDSVFIVPETHGILITSFYHLNILGVKQKTISGKYKHFYPLFLFDNKKSSTWIDIELVKRTIAFTAGSNSGILLPFRGILNDDWLNFNLTFHRLLTREIYDSYKKLLSRNFEKKFYILNK